jgi:hypothetical protein
MKKPVLDQSKDIQIQLDAEDDSNDWFFWPEEEGYLYKTYGVTEEEDYEEMIIQALMLCLEKEE